MNFLGRYKLETPKKYIYVSALLFTVAVNIQISSSENTFGTYLLLKRLVLFGSVYFLWTIIIDYINALVKPFQEEKNITIQIIERFVSAIVLISINLILSNFIYYAFLILTSDFLVSEIYSDFQPYLLKSFFIRLTDLIVIAIILKLIQTNQALQNQKLKLVSLESQLHLSQLETLRNQLDPHFLFNTLHTLNTLIGYDDKKAKSMVIKVTNLLRKILDKREKQLITFDEEIDFFKNLLDIEEERFHDRLEVSIDIEDETREILVPTLMLQPLIENAFKHGISQIEDKGFIKLKAYLENKMFTISLLNSVPPYKSKRVINSTKVGLENLENRLKQVYGSAFELKIEKNESSFVVIIKINT